jgi:hypothetical protein
MRLALLGITSAFQFAWIAYAQQGATTSPRPAPLVAPASTPSSPSLRILLLYPEGTVGPEVVQQFAQRAERVLRETAISAERRRPSVPSRSQQTTLEDLLLEISGGHPRGTGKPIQTYMVRDGQTEVAVVSITSPGPQADPTARPNTCSCACPPGTIACYCRDPKKDDYFCYRLLDYDPVKLTTFPEEELPLPPCKICTGRLVVVTFGQTESSLPKFLATLRSVLARSRNVAPGTEVVQIMKY